MVGNTISRCRIIDKLGGPGVGVVYKAEDTRLRRAHTPTLIPAALGLGDSRQLHLRFPASLQLTPDFLFRRLGRTLYQRCQTVDQPAVWTAAVELRFSLQIKAQVICIQE